MSCQKLTGVKLTDYDVYRSLGCDAVDPDNVDGFNNDSGFPLKAADQVSIFFSDFLTPPMNSSELSTNFRRNFIEIDVVVDQVQQVDH